MQTPHSVQKKVMKELLNDLRNEVLSGGLLGVAGGLMLYLGLLWKTGQASLVVLPVMGVIFASLFALYGLIRLPARYRQYTAFLIQHQRLIDSLGANPRTLREEVIRDGDTTGFILAIASTIQPRVFWSGTYHRTVPQYFPHHHLVDLHPDTGYIRINYVVPIRIRKNQRANTDDASLIGTRSYQGALVLPTNHPPLVAHMLGTPPDLQEELIAPQLLPWPQVLVLRERPDGVFLERWTATGDYAGDTWHETLDQAYQQAHYEYGDLLGSWQAVPPDVKDVMHWLQLHQRNS